MDYVSILEQCPSVRVEAGAWYMDTTFEERRDDRLGFVYQPARLMLQSCEHVSYR